MIVEDFKHGAKFRHINDSKGDICTIHKSNYDDTLFIMCRKHINQTIWISKIDEQKVCFETPCIYGGAVNTIDINDLILINE